MEKTTSRKLARKRLVAAQHDAAAAREARERANLGDLTEFTVRLAQVDEVDDWFAGRVEKLRCDAEQKRHRHRVAAGKALNAMRLRGETIAGISGATGLSVNRLRELMKFAADDSTEETAAQERRPAAVLPLPNRGTSHGVDGARGGDTVAAQ